MRWFILIFSGIYFFITLPALCGSIKGYTDKDEGWRAGVARVNITPQEPMWMGAYASRNRPAEEKRHDLWAKALALEDADGNQVVMVSADLAGIRKGLSDRIRRRLKDLAGLSHAQILLNSSHTHAAPETEYTQTHSRHALSLAKSELEKIDRYARKLEDQIVELVQRALQSMQPAQLFSANGITRFQVNRRNNKESELNSYTELKGPNDYAVPVIKVVSQSGEMLAVAFAYACHNTVLREYKWSGDYAGFAQLELEKLFPGVTALFFQGAGGDQNPLPRRTPALAQQYGKELAGAVERVLNEEMRQLSPRLQSSYSEIELGFAKPSPTATELLEIQEASSGNPDYLKYEARFLYEKLRKGESLMTSYAYPVQVWKLGEQSLIALGGEVTIGYAMRLKQILGNDIFVLGYSNDVMAYIPTETILEEGGYEGARSPLFTTPWAPGIENNIINEVLRLSAGMQ